MPRENRKRGKKHKKTLEQPNEPEPEFQAPVEEPAGPSWIVSAPSRVGEENGDAPFGYVEPDVKAYFRTVDLQIRDWQSEDPAPVDSDMDPNAERHMFFVAALSEMTGKEKQLATDPECSPVLERMCYSMDDFVRRVFLDSLTGSFEALIKNRYASHVCQTFFTVAKETISREARGVFPSVSESSEHGELRTLTQLVLDVCEEISPNISMLIMDPFASHVLRSLLLLLNPSVSLQEDDVLRSRKSASWKARQGPMKSMFTSEKGKEKEAPLSLCPDEFRSMSRQILTTFSKAVNDNELRALSLDKVSSPTLNVFVEVEAIHDLADAPGSIMDRILGGLIASAHDGTPSHPSELVNTYLRDSTSSHLLETIVARVSAAVFPSLWKSHFRGNLRHLVSHPVANFVIAKAVQRISNEQLTDLLEELADAWGSAISTARTGTLRAAIERAAALCTNQDQINQAIFNALGLSSSEERKLLVPCLLRLQALEQYRKAQAQQSDEDASSPTVQGAILLQALLRFESPFNEPVTESINVLAVEAKLAMAHNAIASRVLDALLDSPTVPAQVKRKYVLSLIDAFHLLVDDRIGSRVADRCWAFADTYLKKKIATALIPHENLLLASHYGKFFARNLNLYLLQRRPEEWVNWQSQQSRQKAAAALINNSTSQRSQGDKHCKVAVPAGQSPAAPLPTTTATSAEKKKRKRGPVNEIDQLFDTVLGKRVKTGVLTPAETKSSGEINGDNESGLKDVFKAIRSAPASLTENKHRKKR